MKRLGIHMSFGTDSPIEDMNPIDNLYWHRAQPPRRWRWALAHA